MNKHIAMEARLDTPTRMYAVKDARQRWLALIVQCIGIVMIVIDSTVVNVSLPSIQQSLGLHQNTLVWLVNAYVVPYSGLLLVTGRCGDRYGHRRVFLIGVGGFTLASLLCAAAMDPLVLITGRVLQGLCGAAVASVGLSLILSEFQEPTERARALAVFSFVCASGGSLGVLLGGVLTSELNWRWIFWVNLPLGLAVCALVRPLTAPNGVQVRAQPINVRAALVITLTLMLAIWGTLQLTDATGNALASVVALAAAAVLLGGFVAMESRSSAPLIPRTVVRDRTLSAALIAGALWSGAMFSWSFTLPLYLQNVSRYDALHVGLTFLPTNVLMAVFALGLSARLAIRLGVRNAFCLGMALVTLGLALCMRLPPSPALLRDVLPGMLLVGLGTGIAYNPLMLEALRNVGPVDYGAASGLVNSALTVGGALALALCAGLGAAYTRHALESAQIASVALHAGYRLVFTLAMLCAACATILAALRFQQTPPGGNPVAPGEGGQSGMA